VLGRSGAVICDTESVWLGRLAERRPFAVVRAIVDTPERELVSLQTVTGGITGLRRLSQAAAVIAETLGG
jgi:4-hydroxy-3-methylbut-2-enyl diphosphate reductase